MFYYVITLSNFLILISQNQKMSKQSSTEYESFDEMDSMDGMGQSQLFYSLTIKSGDNESELEPPMIPGYVIHITSATFGVDVNKGSKTTVLTQTEPDGPFFPICKLIETHNETTNIDLLFDGMLLYIYLQYILSIFFIQKRFIFDEYTKNI